MLLSTTVIHRSANLPAADLPSGGPTILVGDDDENFCQLLSLLLSRAGYSVIVANNGHAVVSLAQERRPDLVLLDLVMPMLDGYEALRQLRNDTRTAHVPLILVSGRDAPADLVTGFDNGADDYVTKPIKSDELIARIGSHLRRAARKPVHSPLTGLPGNQLLTEEIRFRQRRGARFTLLHFDLSAFKAFNDTYGFARGDQAIHTLAECLRLAAETSSDRALFLGHIGGDDFAAVCAPEVAEALCIAAIASFDACAPELYDDDDRRRGFIECHDRDGMPCRYGLIGLVIGGATHTPGAFPDPETISQHVASMKQQAKSRGGSAYCIAQAESSSTLSGPHPAL